MLCFFVVGSISFSLFPQLSLSDNIDKHNILWRKHQLSTPPLPSPQKKKLGSSKKMAKIVFINEGSDALGQVGGKQNPA
jgi:hypothetical protein